MTEVKSRIGDFTVIKMGQTVLICQCDTRMRILEALSKGALTGEELARKISVSYSCVMDHIDFLEKLGVVRAHIQREEGRRTRRRIHFHLNQDPVEAIEELFMTSKRNRVRNRSQPLDAIPV
jgi:DNA-binding MarR family transcriptional regulator